MIRRSAVKHDSMYLVQCRRRVLALAAIYSLHPILRLCKMVHGVSRRRIRLAGLGFAALLAAGSTVLAAEGGRVDTDSKADAPDFGREIEFGIASHDLNGEGGRETGLDFALVLRGERFDGVFWQKLLSPRPHIGVNIHNQFKTSSLYAGLTWSVPFGEIWFVSADFGGAVHNGKLDRTTNDRVALGSRVLFREALEIGVRINERWRAGVRADHMSNADLASPNDGVTTLGIMLARDF